MSPLQSILQTYRETAQTERETGTCFEELVRADLRYEARYAELDYGSAGTPARTGSGRMRTGVSSLPSLRPEDHRVVKTRFTKDPRPRNQQERPQQDRCPLQRAPRPPPHPLEAYDYVVNGKPALEWVMERQSLTTDKASGIANDANLWATETMGDAKYPLELFLRVVTVSVETMRIVRGLPGLGVL